MYQYRENLSDGLTPEDLLMAKEAPPPIPLQDHRQARLLQRAVAELPEPEREALQLSLEGKTQWDIAEILAVSQRTAGNRLHRAKRRLRWLTTTGMAFTAAELETALQGRMLPKYIAVLAAMWRTTSLADTALNLGWWEGTTKRRLKTALSELDTLASQDVALVRFRDGLRSLKGRGGGRLMRVSLAVKMYGRRASGAGQR